MKQPYQKRRYPLFRIRGSIIDDIAFGVVIATVWSAIITALYELAEVNLAIPAQVFIILSFVTSLILVSFTFLRACILDISQRNQQKQSIFVASPAARPNASILFPLLLPSHLSLSPSPPSPPSSLSFLPPFLLLPSLPRPPGLPHQHRLRPLQRGTSYVGCDAPCNSQHVALDLDPCQGARSCRPD